MTTEAKHNSDKRVIRTKKAIKTALFKIMESKDISSVTISELTAEANVNRRTFYTHYRCITDILDEIENELVAALTTMMRSVDFVKYDESIETLFTKFHEIITGDFAYYFRLMKLDTRAFLTARLKKALTASAESMFASLPRPVTGSSSMAAFVAGGFLAFYTDWYYSENRMPIEQAAAIIGRLANAVRAEAEKNI